MVKEKEGNLGARGVDLTSMWHHIITTLVYLFSVLHSVENKILMIRVVPKTRKKSGVRKWGTNERFPVWPDQLVGLSWGSKHIKMWRHIPESAFNSQKPRFTVKEHQGRHISEKIRALKFFRPRGRQGKKKTGVMYVRTYIYVL